MAADSRKQDSSDGSSATVPPGAGSEPYQGPNLMARRENSGIIDAVKSIKLEDFRTFHKKPCVRDALLAGIGLGFGVGGLRAIFGASIPRASNWAAFTFVFAAIGEYQYCQVKRRMEKDGLRRAMEIMDRKRQEKDARTQEQKEARRRRKLEAEMKSEEAREAQRSRSRASKFFDGQFDREARHDQSSRPVQNGSWRFWEPAGKSTEEVPKAQIKRSPFWNMSPEDLEREVQQQKAHVQEEMAREQTEQPMASTHKASSANKSWWRFW